jgi:hypothetical protein
MAAEDPESSDIAGRPADPFVSARIPSPGDVPVRTVTLSGLLGDSDREGRRRLYFNTRLDYYAEFLNDDVVAVEDIAADQPPFVGLDATRVTLKRDAKIDFVHTRVAAADDFDLDVRRMRGVGRQLPFPTFETLEAECPGPTFGGCPTDIGCGTNFECPSGFTVCKPFTCNCDDTQVGPTCRGITCRATCGDATCGGTCGVTCGATCGATCGQATCFATCEGSCHPTCQATCATCPTVCNVTCGPTCGGATCATTCGATCGAQATCAGTCFQATCGGTCGLTCRNTCGPICEPTFAQTHCFTCRCEF